MVRSMITTVINPFDGLISRYFITLDPVLQSHYEMVAPITFAGDFEVEVEFSSTDTSVYNTFVSGLAGQIDQTEIYARLNSGTGYLSISIRSNGTVVGTFTYGINLCDGKLHKLSYMRVGSYLTVKLDNVILSTTVPAGSDTLTMAFLGSRGGVKEYFDGIIANAKFTDKSGASDVITTFKLDNSPAAENYRYSTELLDNNTFPDNANARQYLVATKGWIITDGGEV